MSESMEKLKKKLQSDKLKNRQTMFVRVCCECSIINCATEFQGVYLAWLRNANRRDMLLNAEHHALVA